MNKEIKNKVPTPDSDFSAELLLDYIQGNLNDKESYELEKVMQDDIILQEAMEGLQNIKNPQVIPGVVLELNNHLQKQIKLRRKRKEKRKSTNVQWVIITALVLLFLLLIAVVAITII